MASFGRRPRPEPVKLNVYDLAPGNEWLAPLGLGFYHSGLEVHGREYTFAGGSGVFSHAPRAPPAGAAPGAGGPPFRFSLELGAVEATSAEVQRVVDGLAPAWPGSAYHVLSRNCNSFADELCVRLTGRGIPGYVNRAAAIGAYLSCILPANMRPPPPVAGSGGGGGGSGGGAAVVVRRAPSVAGGAAPAAAAAGGAPRPPTASAAAAETQARELRLAAALKRQVAAAAAEAAAGTEKCAVVEESGLLGTA
jgi:hypothetical protein